MIAGSARLRSRTIPSSTPGELDTSRRRTTAARLGLSLLAVALLALAYTVARGLEPLPTSYFATGSGGIVVLDLSTSVDQQKAERAHRVLHTLAETEGRVGLVVFSDSAYEMLPPDTRSEELRPLLPFFAPQAARATDGRGSGSPARSSRGQGPGALDSPWSQTFRGGTRISTGLAEARRMIEREGDRRLAVTLLSDLDNSGFDTSSLVDELATYAREGIDLRVIPLFPQPEDRGLFVQLAGEEALVERAELLRNTNVEERQSLVGAFPVALVVAVAALLFVLAVVERWLGRLEWSTAR
jgi:hypothetical protein